MTDRTGFYIYPALAILAGCATLAKADMALYGEPEEPLASGQRYFVQAFDRATTARKCAQVMAEFGYFPWPATACTFRRTGDTIPTIILPLEDLSPVHKHEVYHVRQLDRGEPVDHKGWK
jgi:hypothetical protein